MIVDDLDLFYGKIKHGKILEHKISWKVLKLFAQKCTNDDRIDLDILIVRSNLLYVVSHGKSLWNL